MSGGKIKRFWYFILAGLVLAAGVGAFVYTLYTGLVGLDEALIRVEAPGTSLVDLKHEGRYTIFLETPGEVDGSFASPYGFINGLSIALETGDGQAIPVGPAKGSSTYTINGRHGVSLMQFEVDEPGPHRFSATFVGGIPGHPLVLTLMQGFMGRLIRLILTGFAVLGGGIVLAALVLVLAFTTGRKAPSGRPPGMPDPIE